MKTAPRIVHLFATGSTTDTLCSMPPGHGRQTVITWESTPRDRRCPHCLDALRIEVKRLNALIEMCAETRKEPKNSKPEAGR